MNLINEKITESVEFHRWLKRHDSQLRNYAPDEIANLAIACGFELPTICSGVNDRMSLICRLMAFWESPFAGQWIKLATYENGLDD